MTARKDEPASKRVLEPVERISEVLFGLIMVLTFTGSLSAAESGRAEVRTMLIGAIGCNLAWGLIDAIMYLMGCLADRSTNLRIWQALRQAPTPEQGERVLSESLPPIVSEVLTASELLRIREELMRLPGSPPGVSLRKQDWLGAAAVFLLVVASTIPVVLPFIFIQDSVFALRVSNAIAIVMMLVAGYAFGQLAGYRPFVTAGSMVLLGCVLVALTIALGG